MFWKVTQQEAPGATALDHVDGRFVLHKHLDDQGPHLDLRLDMNGYLMGWRIDAQSLDGTPWATEKTPHSLRWLDSDASAEFLDGGLYMWRPREADGSRALLLKSNSGVKQLRVERVAGLPACAAREVVEALRDGQMRSVDAGRLVRDGIAARGRAIERLCGLGRELDGSAFDAALWRKLLAELTLEEVHNQLRVFELRFDQKYPPSPVSRPECLEEEKACSGAALLIARE